MRVFLNIFFFSLIILFATSIPISAQAGVLNADPDFDIFTSQPTDAWQPFKIGSIGPNIWHSPKGGEGWPSGPALMLTRQTPFDGGVYQVVNVTPGKGYHFEAGWAAVRYSGGSVSNDLGKVARRVGIDPYGGTDAAAASVQWSPELRDGRHFQTPETQIDQYARNNKITIFLRAKSEYSDGLAEVYFDHALLTENASMGTISVAAPTATSAPATATRPRTATAARVAQAPAATSTPQPTNTLAPTATSTDTPRPSATRTPRPSATPDENIDSRGGSSLMLVVLGLGGLGVVGVGLLGFGFVVYRLLGRR